MSARQPTLQFALFAFFLTISFLCNYRLFWLSAPPDTLDERLTYAGVLIFGALLFNAASRVCILSVSCAGLFALAFDDQWSNHETIFAIGLGTLLVVYVFKAIELRTVRVDIATFQDVAIRVLRLEFLAFYFWVGFDKLNPQFFDPASSCAVYQAEAVARLMPIFSLPDAIIQFSGLLTVMCEIGIFVLLLIPRTRRYGLLVGLGFHTMLSVGFPAFQFLVFGFFALFVPESALVETRDSVRSLISRAGNSNTASARMTLAMCTSAWFRAAIGIGVAVLAGEFAHLASRPEGFLMFGQRTYSVASVLVGAVATIAYLAGPTWSRRWAGGSLGYPPVPLLILPLAMLLQGLQPHLGLKDVQSFAMFSNLDTGNGQSNHAIIPASWQFSSNLSDVVVVNWSNVPAIARLGSARENAQSVLRAESPPEFGQSFLALKRSITTLARGGARGIRIAYTRNGVAHQTQNAERDPDLATASWLERRYFATRPVALSNYGACRW